MNWLNDLISRLLTVFPRLTLVQPDEEGVRFTPKLRGGLRIRTLQPGIYVWWPLIQKLWTLKVKTQVKDLRSQSVWTADRHEMTISGAVRYREKSAMKALCEVYDYDQNIQAVALGIIQQYIREHKLECLDTKQIEEEVLKGVREASEGWGLRVERVYITDIGRTWNVRLLTNSGPFNLSEH